jgi:hypothetical protein
LPATAAQREGPCVVNRTPLRAELGGEPIILFRGVSRLICRSGFSKRRTNRIEPNIDIKINIEFNVILV